MIQNKNKNISFTLMQIIYMVMQGLNFFQQTDSNILILKNLTQINTAAIVAKIVFLKLILNI